MAIIGIAISVGGEAERQDDAPAFGPIDVEGAPLSPLPDAGTDPAVGTEAPIVAGIDGDEAPTAIGGPGEPTIVAFLAHWCPHCNAELPLLVDLQQDGTFDGVRTVAVLTGTNSAAPNYPPVSWLEDSGWSGDVLLDDESSTAAAAYGLTVLSVPRRARCRRQRGGRAPPASGRPRRSPPWRTPRAARAEQAAPAPGRNV